MKPEGGASNLRSDLREKPFHFGSLKQLDDRSGNLFEDRHEDDADYVTTEHDNIRDDYE